MINIAYAEESPCVERPPIAPTGEELEKRDWEIFKRKLAKFSEKGMHSSVGRAVLTACYDENERRKKIEAQKKTYDGALLSASARLFYNFILSCPSDDARDSDFLKPWQERRLAQSLEDVMNSPALRQKPENNAYHLAVYVFDRGYRRTDGSGKESEYDCIEGLGLLAIDAANESQNYKDFEKNLKKRLTQ